MGVKLNKKLVLFAAMLFTLGWMSSVIYAGIMDSPSPLSTVTGNIQSANSDAQKLSGNNSRDKLSPSNWINNDQVNVFNDEVVLKIKDAKWAVFTDTKSMDPVIDSTSKAIQVVPANESQIHAGDIVAYKSKYENGIVTHRVIETGKDSKGWYAILKGDNNSYPDPEKVRFENIKRVVVAIIY